MEWSQCGDSGRWGGVGPGRVLLHARACLLPPHNCRPHSCCAQPHTTHTFHLPFVRLGLPDIGVLRLPHTDSAFLFHAAVLVPRVNNTILPDRTPTAPAAVLRATCSRILPRFADSSTCRLFLAGSCDVAVCRRLLCRRTTTKTSSRRRLYARCSNTVPTLRPTLPVPHDGDCASTTVLRAGVQAPRRRLFAAGYHYVTALRTPRAAHCTALQHVAWRTGCPLSFTTCSPAPPPL